MTHPGNKPQETGPVEHGAASNNRYCKMTLAAERWGSASFQQLRKRASVTARETEVAACEEAREAEKREVLAASRRLTALKAPITRSRSVGRRLGMMHSKEKHLHLRNKTSEMLVAVKPVKEAEALLLLAAALRDDACTSVDDYGGAIRTVVAEHDDLYLSDPTKAKYLKRILLKHGRVYPVSDAYYVLTAVNIDAHCAYESVVSNNAVPLLVHAGRVRSDRRCIYLHSPPPRPVRARK
jgi:hypothetical protein